MSLVDQGAAFLASVTATRTPQHSTPGSHMLASQALDGSRWVSVLVNVNNADQYDLSRQSPPFALNSRAV